MDRLSISRRDAGRVAAVVLILILLTPVITSGVLGSRQPTQVDASGSRDTEGTLTVVSAQGDNLGGEDSRIAVIDTDSKHIVWQTTRYSTYYDVDPLNRTTLLYTAHDKNMTTYAVVHNWRTGEVYDRFVVANGSHDIDYLGERKYAYVDGKSHRVVIFNRTTGKATWVYDLTEHYPPTAGGGPDDSYKGDYSHLNDVDEVENGSAFLMSPRNFDRVLLINRSTKETGWALGEEDNFSRLYEQHNPQLIETSPPTVLVADSENDRVVEYRRTGDGWTLVWSFGRNLEWPRDADRLPNGNTLVVDSRYAMEVTPSREVVWRVRVPKFLYDIERMRLGDEPGGPPMVRFRDEFDEAAVQPERGSPLQGAAVATARVYNAARWILPWWVSAIDFWAAAVALLIGFIWGNFEVDWRTDEPVGGPVRSYLSDVTERLRAAPLPLRAGAVSILGILGAVSLGLSVAPSITVDRGVRLKWWLWDAVYHTVGLIGLLEATYSGRQWASETVDSRLRWVQNGLALVVGGMGVVLAVLGLGFVPFKIQISDPGLVATMGTVGVVLGARRLSLPGRLDSFRRPGPHAEALQGFGLSGLSLGVLAAGSVGGGSAGAYLGFGLLFATAGLGAVGQGAQRLASRGEWQLSTALTAVRFAFRLVLLLLVVAVVLRMFGLGTIAGLHLGTDPVTLPNVTLLLLVVLEQWRVRQGE